MTAKIKLDLAGGGYSIEIGSGLMDCLGGRLRGLSDATRATIVTDDIVGPLYADQVVRSLGAAGFDVSVATVPAGDGSKSLEQAGLLYNRLAELGHGRRDPVIALGGGMVGDLAGFVAATWMRGVPLVQCPTTLEADIDASLGGKTAINLPAGKNLIGAFHQPIFVCVDIKCLATLSDRDFRAGLAESVKHAIIREPAFLDWHEQHATAILNREPKIVFELIRRNCGIKAAVVVEDERENTPDGVGRAALNFGHTIGHAIEARSGYALRHGEAVSLGMVAALDLAVRHLGFPRQDRARAESVLQSLGLPVRAPHPLDAADLMARLAGDKKALHRVVRFVLPDRIGRVQWLSSPDEASLNRAIERLAPHSTTDACD